MGKKSWAAEVLFMGLQSGVPQGSGKKTSGGNKKQHDQDMPNLRKGIYPQEDAQRDLLFQKMPEVHRPQGLQDDVFVLQGDEKQQGGMLAQGSGILPQRTSRTPSVIPSVE
jgi:hypothetical protein